MMIPLAATLATAPAAAFHYHTTPEIQAGTAQELREAKSASIAYGDAECNAVWQR